MGPIEHPQQERISRCLFLLATTGKATAMDFGRSSRDHVLLHFLAQEGLIELQLVPIVRNVRICLIRLTEKGNAVCQENGWLIIESEWSRMIRLHQQGNGSDKHTAAVLWFASHARRRGWQVEVMPELGDPYIKPDLLLAKKSQTILGEVEIKARLRFTKWTAIGKLAASRHYILGICSLTPSQRLALARECQQCGVKGMATDLQTISKCDTDSLLWLQNWD